MNNHSPIQSDLFAPSFVSTQVATNTPPVTTSVPTLVEYANKIALRVWPKDHTRRHNLRGIQWFEDFAGPLPMDQIRKRQIYDFVEHLVATRKTGKKQRPLTQNSANKYMAAISRVLSEANEREVIDNPIKLKYEKVVAARPKAFTPDEEKAAVAYLREADVDWIADMMVMSINCGMRRGEILQIWKPEVELSECGKWLYLPERVCKSGERYVPLNTEARAAYERLKPVIKDVFTHARFYYWMKLLRRDIGRGERDFVFHVARHTAATRLAANKVNEFHIADIMGHADTRTTRRYVHAKKASLLAAVEQL
jgi:integrase